MYTVAIDPAGPNYTRSEYHGERQEAVAAAVEGQTFDSLADAVEACEGLAATIYDEDGAECGVVGPKGYTDTRENYGPWSADELRAYGVS